MTKWKIKSIYKEYSEFMSPVDLVLLFVALFFCFVTMYYADITVTGRYGLTFIDSIIDGKPLSFYRNALATGIAPEGAVYDILVYVIFGVWTLPIWILNKLIGISAMSVGSLMWIKLLPTLFMVGTIGLVRDIAEKIGFDHKTSVFASIIYCLSLSTFMPVYVAVQYDVISLFFMLIGIRCYLDNNDKKSFLFFALSMTIKPMTLLILFLLIIFREKNIVKIFMKTLVGSSIMLACKLIYSTDESYRQCCSGFLAKQIGGMFNSSITGSYGDASIFVILIIVIYVIAYLYKSEEKSFKDNSALIVMCFAIWASFCMFGSMTAYWTIYITPFAVYTALIASDQTEVNRVLLIDLVGNVMLTIALVLKYTWVYGGDHTFAYLILKPLCKWVLNGEQGTTVAGILRRIYFEKYLPAVNAVVIACFISIIAVAVYRLKNNVKLYHMDENLLYMKHIRIRIFTMYAWIAATILALIITVIGM
jgi:hypothetical protein